jgi:hypothetical protein
VRPGSNKGPTHDYPLDHPAVKVLVASMNRLKEAAVYEARGAVRRFEETQPGHITGRFFPSRLAKCPRDRKLLAGVFEVAYRPAIATRLAQLNRIDAKIWRICQDWRRHTADELCAVPHFDAAEGRP